MHEVKRQKLDYQEYVNFLNSTDWNKIKGDVMNEIGNECEHCGREFPRRNLRLHHTNYDEEFGFEDSNSGDLMLICEECHNEMHQDIECFDKGLYLIFDIFKYKLISKIFEVITYVNKMYLLQEFH